MKKIAACGILVLATCLWAGSARAATEPPCDTVCGCSTGCARGCTDGGRTTTCGLFGDCHTICIHASTTSVGSGLLALAASPSPLPPPAVTCSVSAPVPSSPLSLLEMQRAR